MPLKKRHCNYHVLDLFDKSLPSFYIFIIQMNIDTSDTEWFYSLKWDDELYFIRVKPLERLFVEMFIQAYKRYTINALHKWPSVWEINQ